MIRLSERELDITIGQATNIVLNSIPDLAIDLGNESSSKSTEVKKRIMRTAIRMIKIKAKVKDEAVESWESKYQIEVTS